MHDFTLVGALVLFGFCGVMLYKIAAPPFTSKDRSILWVIFLGLIGLYIVLSENVFRSSDAETLRANISTVHCHALYKRASSGDSLHIAKNNVYCLGMLTDKNLRWNR